jgi:hypothetical protein
VFSDAGFRGWRLRPPAYESLAYLVPLFGANHTIPNKLACLHHLEEILSLPCEVHTYLYAVEFTFELLGMSDRQFDESAYAFQVQVEEVLALPIVDPDEPLTQCAPQSLVLQEELLETAKLRKIVGFKSKGYLVLLDIQLILMQLVHLPTHTHYKLIHLVHPG